MFLHGCNVNVNVTLFNQVTKNDISIIWKYERGETLTPKRANFDTFYLKKCNFFQFLPLDLQIFAIYSPKSENMRNFELDQYYNESFKI